MLDTTLPPQAPIGAYSVDGFAKSHNLSRVTVYKEINDKRLRIMKVGRRTLISGEAAAEWRALCEKAA